MDLLPMMPSWLMEALPWIGWALWMMSEAIPKMPIKGNSVLEAMASLGKKGMELYKKISGK